MEVSVKEQILILKSYCKNDCNWPEVYKEVKLAVVKENLTENIQQLYTEKPYEKLKRRMADQVQKLIQKMNAEYIESEELRTLVVCIKEKRARYSAKGHPTSRRIKVNLHVYQTHQVTCISIAYIQ